jgi:hypothetical protein
MKELIIFLVGFTIGGWATQSEAQTYVITNPQGYSRGTVQIQGNQAQAVNNQGYITQSLTIYPNQAVTTQGYAIGTPSYTVPSTPMSPPSPRVLQ